MTKIENIKNSKEFEFYQNYAKFVVPKLEKLESERKKSLSTVIILTIGAIIISCIIPLLIFLITQTPYEDFALVIVAAVPIAIVLLACLWEYTIRTFNSNIKNQCMPELLKAFGKINWTPKAIAISDTKIRKSELFGTYNKRENDDTFSGTYKDLKFVVSESNMQNEKGSGRSKRVWPVFNGVIVMIDSNKTIQNKTIITTKGDINVKNSDPLMWISIIGLGFYLFTFGLHIGIITSIVLIGLLLCILIKRFCKNEHKEVLNPVILEDHEFNKKYEVLSSDQIEGRYLVTTAFMERFKTLHTAFGSNKAKCAFFDDKVMFAISTNKNLFEIGDLFHPLTDMKHINDFMKEISAIYEIIDYFKLAEKTGL